MIIYDLQFYLVAVCFAHEQSFCQEHGQCVIGDPQSQPSKAAASASASARSSGTTQKGARFNLDFEVVDSVGQIEAVQKPDGKVYLPGKQCPIGRNKKRPGFNYYCSMICILYPV